MCRSVPQVHTRHSFTLWAQYLFYLRERMSSKRHLPKPAWSIFRCHLEVAMKSA